MLEHGGAGLSGMQGLMRNVIKNLFAKFPHQAVTQDTLLCLISLELAGCRPQQLAGVENTCSAALASLIPLVPPPKDDAKGSSGKETVGAPTANSSSDSRAHRCGDIVDRWMARLRTWIFEPGVQLVELHVSSEPDGKSNVQRTTYQAELLRNRIPGQVCASLRYQWLAFPVFGLEQA
jgi:hypothetical protein